MILLIFGLGMVVIGRYSERPFVEMAGIIMFLCAFSVFTRIKFRRLEQRIQKLESKL